MLSLPSCQKAFFHPFCCVGVKLRGGSGAVLTLYVLCQMWRVWCVLIACMCLAHRVTDRHTISSTQTQCIAWLYLRSHVLSARGVSKELQCPLCWQSAAQSSCRLLQTGVEIAVHV